MALLPLKPGRAGLYLGAMLLTGSFAGLLWLALPRHYGVFAAYAVLLLLLWLLLRTTRYHTKNLPEPASRLRQKGQTRALIISSLSSFQELFRCVSPREDSLAQ